MFKLAAVVTLLLCLLLAIDTSPVSPEVVRRHALATQLEAELVGGSRTLQLQLHAAAGAKPTVIAEVGPVSLSSAGAACDSLTADGVRLALTVGVSAGDVCAHDDVVDFGVGELLPPASARLALAPSDLSYPLKRFVPCPVAVARGWFPGAGCGDAGAEDDWLLVLKEPFVGNSEPAWSEKTRELLAAQIVKRHGLTLHAWPLDPRFGGLPDALAVRVRVPR